MAENTTVETVIFEVDVSDYQNKLVGLTQNIDALKTQQKALREETEKGGKGYLKAAEELEKVNAELKVSQDEYRNTQRTLVGFIGAQKNQVDTTNFANNSIKANRELLKQLQSQYINTKNPTQEFTKTIKTLSDELKKQEGAIGDTRRNVGNYAEGFKEAAKDLNLFGVNLGGVGAGLRASRDGFVAAGGGVKGFSAALATTGLPLIIMGVQALIGAFETFEPIADAVEDAVNGVSNAFKGLLGGGSMSGAIKAGQELTDVMRDLEDTTAAFTITQEKANREIKMLQIIATDRTKAEKERLQALEDADKVQRDLYLKEVERVEALLVVQKNALKAQTGLKNFELEILSTTDNAQDEAYKKLLARAEKELKIDKKALEEYQKTILAKEKLDTQNLVFEEQRVKLANRIIEKQEAEAEKAAERAQAARDKAKAAKEKYDQEIERLTDEFILTEREKLSKSFEDKIKLVTGQGEDEQILRLTIAQAQADAEAKFDADAAAKKEAKRLELLAKEKAIKEKEFNDAIDFNQKQLQLDLNAVELSTDAATVKEQRKREIQLAALEEQLRLTKEFLGADGIITKEELQGIQAIEQAIAKTRQVATTPTTTTFGDAIGISKAQVAEIKDGLQLTSQAVQGISDVINSAYQVRLNDIENVKNAEIDAINQSGASQEDKAKKIQEAERKAALETYEIQKKQFEVNKAIAIVQTIINTAQAVIAQFANPTPFAGAVLAALAAATGAAQLAVIASQPPPPKPAFATGVIGLDGAGTATSDSIDARLSRGESVITAKATERFAPVLAQMELAVGNRPNFQLGNRKFATGYIPTTDGGYSDRAMSSDVNKANDLAKMFSDTIAKMPQPKLVYDEFTKFVDNRNQSVNLSEL